MKVVRYCRIPPYEVSPKYEVDVVTDTTTDATKQVNLKKLIDSFTNEGILITKNLLTLGGSRQDRRYPAISRLIALVHALRQKGIVIQFIDEPWLNDSRVWESLDKFQKGIVAEARSTGIRRKKETGQLKGPNKIKPNLVLLDQLIRRKVSLTKIAKELGVSRGTLYNWKKEGLF